MFIQQLATCFVHGFCACTYCYPSVVAFPFSGYRILLQLRFVGSGARLFGIPRIAFFDAPGHRVGGYDFDTLLMAIQYFPMRMCVLAAPHSKGYRPPYGLWRTKRAISLTLMFEIEDSASKSMFPAPRALTRSILVLVLARPLKHVSSGLLRSICFAFMRRIKLSNAV
ncbi:hypothetical protein EV421DRAFT_629030 [Armillaria borealis]|uniref:Uncharacterized protein n=1 Tax=Armillaria borealis TaxID=47425 RepID=A0AA39JFR8_9AGAR|nr:hypothetical protein EV421DRAFT_629030 [Armillaria borealis]